MRLDKLTIKAQEALQAAHELAASRAHQELTPEHVLAALLDQQDGIARRHPAQARRRPGGRAPGGGAGARRAAPGARRQRGHLRRAAAQGPDRRGDPPVEGVQGRVRLQRAPACWPWWPRTSARASRALKDAGVRKDALLKALAEVRGNQRVTDPEAEGKYQALAKYTRDLTELARNGQARSGDRPRRGDPPLDAGALAPHQEQPGADRRARRRQDRDRRGHRAAHRDGRRARVAARTRRSWRSTWAR